MLVECSDSRYAIGTILYRGCESNPSLSTRVNEQALFSVEPGTIFTARNIANQFDEDDPSSYVLFLSLSLYHPPLLFLTTPLCSNAVLSYAVQTLKVKHVIVMGHYGCGGIAASMIPSSEHKVPTPCSANLAVHNWISPIRQIYQNSNRFVVLLFAKSLPRKL